MEFTENSLRVMLFPSSVFPVDVADVTQADFGIVQDCNSFFGCL